MKHSIIFEEAQKSALIFLDQIVDRLSNNIDYTLSKSLSNLLAIDYANRLKSEPLIHDYVNICVTRLKNHLEDIVILNNNFSEAMTLFTVAITPENDSESKRKEQSIDALINATISELFEDLSSEEHDAVKSFIKQLIKEKKKGHKAVLQSIKSQPEKFKEIVANAISRKVAKDDISNFISNDLQKLTKSEIQKNKKINRLRGNFGKTSLIVGSLITASLGLAFGGLLLSAIIIPSIITTIKITPIVADKLTNIYTKDESVEVKQSKSKYFIPDLVDQKKEKNIDLNPEISKKQIKNIAQKVSVKKDNVSDLSKPDLEKQKKKNRSKKLSI